MIGDTNILDLDTSVFEKSDEVIEEGVERKISRKNHLIEERPKKRLIKNIIKNKYKDQPITIENEIKIIFLSALSVSLNYKM